MSKTPFDLGEAQNVAREIFELVRATDARAGMLIAGVGKVDDIERVQFSSAELDPDQLMMLADTILRQAAKYRLRHCDCPACRDKAKVCIQAADDLVLDPASNRSTH